MGFLGLSIPSIKVFSDNNSPGDEVDVPETPVDGTEHGFDSLDNLGGAQRSLESLHIQTPKYSNGNSSTQSPDSPAKDQHGHFLHHNTSNTSRNQHHNNQNQPKNGVDEEKQTPKDPISHMILQRVNTDSLHNSPQPSTPTSLHSPSFPPAPAAPAAPASASNENDENREDIKAEKQKSNSTNATKFLSSNSYPKEIPSNETFRKSGGAKPNTPGHANSANSQGFFSKFLKPSARPTSDDEQDVSTFDKRDEGWNADVFGYIPNYPTPPKYIHMRAHRKQKREMNHVFLAQELNPYPNRNGKKTGHINHHDHNNMSTPGEIPGFDVSSSNSTAQFQRENGNGPEISTEAGAIWCAKFSQDGKYLATAGEDRIVRVWQVLSCHKDRECFQEDDDDDAMTLNTDDDAASFVSSRRGGSKSRYNHNRKQMYAPVFKPHPVREYYGHSSDVLDISWSKNNFLLSSSMDKTVRLWHVDRSDCLCTFVHSDFVTSIQFHPTDDRFFLSGSLDCKLRLWSIPDKEVAFHKDVPDLITAVAFTPDGLTAIVGCFGGQCLFYETDGLHFQNQLLVRSSRGKNSKGSKITGIEAFLLPSSIRYQGSFDNEVKLLISTNDSRVRLYNLHDKSMDVKFKGHENEQSQIHATFSDNGMYIISGSEDDRTYIWRVFNQPKDSNHKKKDVQEYEYFHSNKSPVTVALFAPTSTKKTLALSDDPVYDLCDPPPVRLMPKDDESYGLEENSSPEAVSRKSTHPDGHIIITADQEGYIKVFRQDCAYEPRKVFADNSSIMSKNKRLSTLSPSQSWRDSISIHRSRSRNGRGGGGAASSSIRGVSPSQVSTRLPRIGGGNSPMAQRHQGTGNNFNPPQPQYRSSSSRGSSPPPSRRGSLRDGVIHPIDSGSSFEASYQLDVNRPAYASPLARAQQSTSSRGSGNEEELKCSNCDSASFKARRVEGQTTLVCSNCNALAS